MNAPEPIVHSEGVLPIALGLIAVSKSNPRKHFDEAKLGELTESVRKHGVIQPILVRPAPKAKANGVLWELVAGERRYRAARAAGLAEIPAIARTLTDAEALELQVVENLQREDLHPLEEAEGYELLIREHHYTAEDLAAKVGKSKAYVYARLKLTALTAKGREAFYADKLNPSTALLIARIPVPKLQDEALKEITATTFDGALRHSVRSAMQFLQQHYMLRLGDAPFPTGDEQLLPAAGTCATCPKRTGNQRELFGDVKSADVCTDPECFDAKKAAHTTRLRAAAEAKGQRVISGKDAKKIIPYDSVNESSGYIGLDEKNYNDRKYRTNRALIGKECPTPILVEHPESGKLVEVVAKKDVAGLLKVKLPPGSKANGGGQGDDYKKRQAKAKLETTVNSRIFEAIAEKHPGTMTPADAAVIAAELLDRTEHECVKHILRRWEPEAFEKAKGEVWALKARFAKRIPALSAQELVHLMIELAIVSDVHVGTYSAGKPEKLLATAARLSIDHAAIRRELVDAKKAKTRAPKKAPKKSAKAPRKSASSPKTQPARESA